MHAEVAGNYQFEIPIRKKKGAAEAEGLPMRTVNEARNCTGNAQCDGDASGFGS
jgi:hypothetical protein